jgi:hypothetical protein
MTPAIVNGLRPASENLCRIIKPHDYLDGDMSQEIFYLFFFALLIIAFVFANLLAILVDCPENVSLQKAFKTIQHG